MNVKPRLLKRMCKYLMAPSRELLAFIYLNFAVMSEVEVCSAALDTAANADLCKNSCKMKSILEQRSQISLHSVLIAYPLII